MSSGSTRPSNDGPNALVLTGVSVGAAGIGFFFLRLNHVTRNPAYLGKARSAVDYNAPTQHPSDAASELVQSPTPTSWRCRRSPTRLTPPPGRR
jgi:lantibiotic modifying enzyme